MSTEKTQGGYPADVTPPASAPVQSPALTENRATTELPQPDVSKEDLKEIKAAKTAASRSDNESSTPEVSKEEEKDIKTAKASVKKAAAKKAAAKKAPAKKAAAKKTAAKKDSKLSVEDVASEILKGSQKWHTGSLRDKLLVEQGYDLNEVRNEITRQRAHQANS